MDHLIILYHFFLTVLGAVVAGFLFYLAKRNGQKRDRFLLLFFLSFFFTAFLPVINKYLRLNLYEFYASYFEVVVNINLIARLALLVSLLLFIHEFISFKKNRIVLSVLVGAVIVAFILRISVFKTILLESGRVRYHPTDLLDLLSLLIVLYGLGAIYFLLKSITERLWNKLFKRMLITALILLPGILADTWHLYPIKIHFSSLLFLCFSGILFSFIIESLKAGVPHGLPIPRATGELPGLPGGISEREQEIVHLVKVGMSNKEIGQKLFISLSTVKSHLYNIYRKTGVKNRYELIRKSETPDR